MNLSCVKCYELFLNAKVDSIPKGMVAPKNTMQTGLSSAWTRATFLVNKDLNEKIKAVAYWDRLTVKEVLHEALMEYLKGRSVKPVPKKRPLEL